MNILNQKNFRTQFENEAIFKSIINHPWYKPPRIGNIYNISSEITPVYSLVVPIHNQESLIDSFLKAHEENCEIKHDIYVIFDNCSDNSLIAFRKYINENKLHNACKIVEILTDVPYFETACDNIGFYFSETPYIIELQIDILIQTRKYDAKLISVLNNEKVSFVSGRCGHSLGGYIYSNKEINQVGLTSTKIQEEGLNVKDDEMVAFYSETVNRGPIAYRRKDLIKLSYLDHDNFFLGNDDHDLSLRAYLATGQVPAYRPLKIKSDLKWGTTRKQRDEINSTIMQKLSERPNNSCLQRFNNFYKSYQKIESFNLEL